MPHVSVRTYRCGPKILVHGCMPELPDVTVYIEGLQARVVGQRLARVRLASPFVLRSVDPPIAAANGRVVVGVRRLGKRVVLALDDDLYLVIHLMIAGRFRWERCGVKPPGKIGLAAFDFATGTLLLTEASPKKRAALYLVRGAEAVAAHDPGGIEVLEADAATFRVALRRENHTLKRALTDRHLFSGIGNAYSDEILHYAKLSPLTLTSKLSDDAIERLFQASRTVLTEWVERLRRHVGGGFPEKVTAFRDAMAVHGRFKQPCPVCGSPVQRIVYAENECN